VGKPLTLTSTDRLRFHGHDVEGARIARGVLERMKMGRDCTEAVCLLVADHLRLDPVKHMKVATLKRLLRRDDIEDLLALHRADCLGSHGGLDLYDFARARQKEFREAEASQGLRPEPLLGGSDLIAWGYRPGPRFKVMLEGVEDEQLEGRLSDKSAAKEFILAHFQKDDRP
jgi:poly(A) polymerase